MAFMGKSVQYRSVVATPLSHDMWEGGGSHERVREPPLCHDLWGLTCRGTGLSHDWGCLPLGAKWLHTWSFVSGNDFRLLLREILHHKCMGAFLL